MSVRRGAIGFDYSHNNKLTLEGSGYADFTQFLFSSSFQLGKIQAGFDSLEKVKKYNLIMISSPTNSKFTPEEIEILLQYVKEGGNLLIISSSGSDYSNNTNMNDLTKNLGFEFEFDELHDSVSYKFLQKRPIFTNLKPHFITEQVQRVIFSSACSIRTLDFLEDDENIDIEKIILTGLNSWRKRYNGEDWVEEDCPKVPVLVVVEYYKGKVVAFGSMSIFSSIGREYGFSALENDVLIANILRWLAMDAYAEKYKILNAQINMELFYWMNYLMKEQNWEDFSDIINVSLKYFKDNYKEIVDEITSKQMEKTRMKQKYEQEHQRKMKVSEEEKILDIVIERKKKDLIEIMEELEEITGEKYELSIDLEETIEEEESLDMEEAIDIEELQKDSTEEVPEVREIKVEEEKIQAKEELDEEFDKMEKNRKKFKKMTIQNLRHIAKENDITIPPHAKKKEIIDILVNYYST